MNDNDNKKYDDDDFDISIIDLRQLRKKIREITDNIDSYKDSDKGKDDDLFDECWMEE